MAGDYRDLMRAAAAAAGLQPRAIVQPQDREAVLNGIGFHYLDWGDEGLPPVVLLHGGRLTAHTWDLAALLLRERYRLIAPDQRGHGDSGWTPDAELGRDNAELMLEDTRQFLEHLALRRIALVGMSMGGMNAIRYAARHPGRLAALGIVDVAPETMREGELEMEQFAHATETLARFEDFLEQAKRFMPHRPEAHLRYSLTHSLKPTAQGYTWKQDPRPRPRPTPEQIAERRESLWRDVRAIRTPTLLFRGAQSKILSQEVAERMVKAMADARLVTIPRATHNVHSDNPADFARALDAFLREVAFPEAPVQG
jgi:pimeloyl-ACP methyl ester carboxylesterase